MKTARIFDTGRSKAVRLPKKWIEGVREVDLEQEEDRIVIRLRKDLWQVAKECAELKGGFPDRLLQGSSGIRSRS